ncbi:MAG: UvrD-helicase domain-containing protein [Myxococcales bacterium]|nr:UvrD-helicase domain-containing protein [Myxococcales bacterium]
MEYVVIVGVIVFVGAMLYARRARQNEMLQRARRVIALADRFRASDDGEYFTASALRRVEQELGDALNERLRPYEVSLLADAAVRERVREAQKVLDDRRGAVDRYNRDFVERRLNEAAPWFDKRATRLTPEQRRAVVTDEDATLVIAAAGSGKTATIVAKAEYLVWRKRARPDQICLLAFNKRAADEIRERLQQVGLGQVQVSTFHALGYAVHGSALGTRNPVSNLTESGPLDDLLQKALRGLLNNDIYFAHLAQWFWDKRVTTDMFQGASTPHARLQKERSLGLKTLTGVWVRSQAEVKLADWMTLNGLEWSYETPYPHGPDDPNRRRYQPDFFLPKYDLWMELWALNRAGETSTVIDAKKYRKDMDWKRSLHQSHRTTLVEVWQDEVWNGKLDEYMRSQLAKFDVALQRIASDHLFELLAERNQAAINGLPTLMGTFLKLHRGGLWTRDELQGRARKDRDRAFLNVYLPVHAIYEDTLRQRGEIDFDDMLGGAVDLLKQVQTHRFRYVLVDEFQDTSRSRMAFTRALRNMTPDARLFLVGDDWQSINRFAGSDLALFTKVEKELGFTARVTLGTTFRLLPDVTAISSRFVMQNPAQIAKEVRTPKPALDEFGVVLHAYQEDDWVPALREVLDLIVARKKQGSSVLLLGRYRHYLEQDELKALVKEYRAKGLNMDLTTVHSSKGLEAEHVIVLNVNSGMRGFPNAMEDDPVLQLVSAAPDEFEFAEERRLMYVAITRSRGRVYLLHSSTQPSVFIEELLEREGDHIEKLGHISVKLPCPTCGGRTIHRREGQYGPFWGCTNFPQCDGRLVACDRCKEGALVLHEHKTLQCNHCKAKIERCPRCNDGHLILRTNRSAGTTFWGCSGWRPDKQGCDYKRSH